MVASIWYTEKCALLIGTSRNVLFTAEKNRQQKTAEQQTAVNNSDSVKHEMKC